MSSPSGSRPPVAARFRPGASLGAASDDPYAGMRDSGLAAMRDYLAAERAYYDRQMEAVRGLREELAAELIVRTPEAEDSPTWRRGGHTYFTRTVPGRQLQQLCRAAGGGRAHGLLDETLLL